jgi:hypothetical protein
MQRTTGKQLSEAGAAFKFGPAGGVNFFSPYGWEPKDVQGRLKTSGAFQTSARRAAVLATRAQGGTPEIIHGPACASSTNAKFGGVRNHAYLIAAK